MTVHFSALRQRRRRLLPLEKRRGRQETSESYQGAERLEFGQPGGSFQSYRYYSIGIMVVSGLLVVSLLVWIDRSSGSTSLFPPLGGWKVSAPPLVAPENNHNHEARAPPDAEQRPSDDSVSVGDNADSLSGGSLQQQRRQQQQQQQQQQRRRKRDVVLQWLSNFQRHWRGKRKKKPRQDGERGLVGTEAVPKGAAIATGAAAASSSLQRPAMSPVDAARFSTAFTLAPELNAVQLRVLREFAEQVHHDVVAPNTHASKKVSSITLSQRLSKVPWGGNEPWWDPPRHSGHYVDALDRLDGGRLLHSYYRIMQVAHDKHRSSAKQPAHQPLTDLSAVHFPFGQCSRRENSSSSHSSASGGGCPASRAIGHTLAWRESYKPWMVDPAAVAENSKGWIYARGFSPSSPTTGSSSSFPATYGQHAILWARPGVHRSVDGTAYVRCLLHSADRAVALALQRSGGRVGKFNAVVDARGYEFGKSLPALSHLKEAVHMLQDHFPDRLGVVVLVNLSRTAELVVNLVKPWLTKEVRDKIHAVRVDQLSLLVEPHDIPDWLGGPDSYRFDAESYYPPEHRFSSAEARQYHNNNDVASSPRNE